MDTDTYPNPWLIEQQARRQRWLGLALLVGGLVLGVALDSLARAAYGGGSHEPVVVAPVAAPVVAEAPVVPPPAPVAKRKVASNAHRRVARSEPSPMGEVGRRPDEGPAAQHPVAKVEPSPPGEGGRRPDEGPAEQHPVAKAEPSPPGEGGRRPDEGPAEQHPVTPVAVVAPTPTPTPAPIATATPPPPPEPVVDTAARVAAETVEQVRAVIERPAPKVINIPDDIGVGDHFPSLVPEHPVGAPPAR